MGINSLDPEGCGNIFLNRFLRIDIQSTSCVIGLWWVSRNPIDDKAAGSGNALVPSGNKLLPEQMLTQMYVTILRQICVELIGSGGDFKGWNLSEQIKNIFFFKLLICIHN